MPKIVEQMRQGMKDPKVMEEVRKFSKRSPHSLLYLYVLTIA